MPTALGNLTRRIGAYVTRATVRVSSVDNEDIGDNSRKQFWKLVDGVSQNRKMCYRKGYIKPLITSDLAQPQIKSLKSVEPSADLSSKAKQLISAAAKRTNLNYVNAISSRKSDEVSWRVDRLLRRLRPRYSKQAYAHLATGVSALDRKELIKWMLNAETRLSQIT